MIMHVSLSGQIKRKFFVMLSAFFVLLSEVEGRQKT